MTQKRMLYQGSGCAMVTPFTKDNTVDCAALKDQAAFQIQNGTDALIVCGTTGEASTMTPKEQREAVEAVVEAVGGRVPVIAGVGGNDTVKAMAACRAAKEAGAVAALAVTPYYNKTTQAGLVAHFTALADSSQIPLILYNVPARTGLNLKPATAEKLSRHENIIGHKEASGDIAQISEIVRLCGENLPIYSGSDECTLPILAVGGIGVISVVANIAPAQMHDLCVKFFQGKMQEARAIQLRILPLIDVLFCETSPSPVKTAMDLMGFKVGPVRLPLVPMLPENLSLLRANLSSQGLIG